MKTINITANKNQSTSSSNSNASNYVVKWAKNASGSENHQILLRIYNGPFHMHEWLKKEALLAEKLDDVEQELIIKDRLSGTYNKIDIIVDVSEIDFTNVKPMSNLSTVLNSSTFCHPRSGKIIYVGIENEYYCYSKAVMKTVFDIYLKMFNEKEEKILRADTIQEAIQMLSKSNHYN